MGRFKGADLKGKIVIVLINDPDFETGEGDFGGKAMTYYGRWTYKYEEAARRGAGRLADRPRDRSRLLRLGHGQELQHQHHVRRRPTRTRRFARALEGWIQRDSAAACSRAPGWTSTS